MVEPGIQIDQAGLEPAGGKRVAPGLDKRAALALCQAFIGGDERLDVQAGQFHHPFQPVDAVGGSVREVLDGFLLAFLQFGQAGFHFLELAIQALAFDLGLVAFGHDRFQVGLRAFQVVAQGEVFGGEVAHLVFDPAKLLVQLFAGGDDFLPLGHGGLEPGFHGLQVLLQDRVLFHQSQHDAVVFFEIVGDGAELGLVFGHVPQQAAVG